MKDEYQQQLELYKEKLGGDKVATAVANALMRNGYDDFHKVLAASHGELAALRNVGVEGALRLGELRGSLRPGFRGRLDMTTCVFDALYESLSRMVKDREHNLVSCASLGQHKGLPPEIEATIQTEHGFRYTLYLTPTEVHHGQAQA